LTGDSCGGHFSIDIVRKAIKNNVRKPDGILLIYPSTRIVFENMGPSFGMSTRDSFIEISLMGNMQRAVLDLEKFDLDHYDKDDNLNFYKTSSEIIRNFPKTYILVASNDPMKDESFILADFLL
jgi:acetyl esterase/lipase